MFSQFVGPAASHRCRFGTLIRIGLLVLTFEGAIVFFREIGIQDRKRLTSADQHQFVRASPWKRSFPIIRWKTYTLAWSRMLCLLHKAPPHLLVEPGSQALTRAGRKI